MDNLRKLLSELESPGTFAASGIFPTTYPGLFVNNVGEISWPLLPAQAAAIMAECEQAPYGLGELTIVDTNVRNVWQLAPDAFQLRNPAWSTALQAVCATITQQLGLGEARIESQLYKLLLYGKGCFFAPHRDTEKMDNMFATLVVNLPSAHQGGELLIHHAEKNVEYSFAGKMYGPEYAVFYADCFHEVKPVLEGFRCCLVYNLALAGRSVQPKLSHFDSLRTKINSAIQNWSKKKLAHPIFAYLLEHSYSEHNLSLDNLKSSDYLKASVLLQAAAEQGCQASLCLVSYFEESYGEYHGYYHKRRKPYHGNDEDEEESSCSEGNYQEYEVTKREIYAHSLLTSSLDKIVLQEECLVADEPLIGGPGREVSISEATGNEGATKELWYHRGAVVIWPDSAEDEILAYADFDYVCALLADLYASKEWKTDFVVYQRVAKIASLVVDRLTWSAMATLQKLEFNLFTALIECKYVNLLKIYVQKFLGSHSFGLRVSHSDLAGLIKTFSFATFEDQIAKFIEKKDCPLGWLRNLHLALSDFPTGQTALLTYERAACEKGLKKKLVHYDVEKLSDLFYMLALLNDATLLDQLLSLLNGIDQLLFSMETLPNALIRALQAISSADVYHIEVFQALSQVFTQTVAKHYSLLPEKPTNWVRPGQSSCTCDFCKQLNKFLPDPHTPSMTISKTQQYNLLHVEEMIKKAKTDVQLEIVREKGKFTGLFTKTDASYQATLKLYLQAHSRQQQIQELLADKYTNFGCLTLKQESF